MLSCFIANSAYYTQESDITGTWMTIDDRTKLPTSHIEITRVNDKYQGKVINMLRDDQETVCEKCVGEQKNKPIMHMIILRDLAKTGTYWSGGKILDPDNGKEYKCNIHLKSKDKLVLRGYIGAPIFGRSQEWFRVNS